MKLKTLITNSSSHSYLRPSLSTKASASSSSPPPSSTSSPSISPRSFLVKKYLKQKYDADFKLQQKIKAEAEEAAAAATAAATATAVSVQVSNVMIPHPPSSNGRHETGGEKDDQSVYNSSNFSYRRCKSGDRVQRYEEYQVVNNEGNSYKKSSINSFSSSNSSKDETESRVSSDVRSDVIQSAMAPYTPSSYPRPVAVMLSNGCIIDVSSFHRDTRQEEGAKLAGCGTAQTPSHTNDTATSDENDLLRYQQSPRQDEAYQRRSSVIVSGDNQFSDRRHHYQHSVYTKNYRHHPYAGNRLGGISAGEAEVSAANRYLSSPHHSPPHVTYVVKDDVDERAIHHRRYPLEALPSEPEDLRSSPAISERRHSESIAPSPPPPSHYMPSPPPAHTPITSLLPRLPVRNNMSPAPAHSSTPSSNLMATLPVPSQRPQTPPPAHSTSSIPANFLLNDPRPGRSPSPSYQHNSPKSAPPVADVLPADHPIHHPLVQQLINQRLHVPDMHAESRVDPYTSSSPRLQHSPKPADYRQMRSEVDYHEDEVTPISPPYQESDVIYNYEPSQPQFHPVSRDSEFKSFQYADYRQIPNDRHALSSNDNLSAKDVHVVAYSAGYSHTEHMPPSPSPSLPAASPNPAAMAPATSPLVISPTQEATQFSEDESATANSATGSSTAYTYEAFLVSDGRSRKRSLSSVSTEDLDSNDASFKSNTGTGSNRPRYTCGECGKDYATSSNLSRHKQTHRSLDSKSAKKCPHCDKVYVSMPALSMHILTHDLKHPCTVCGKNFSRPWLLQGHMRSHTGEKPFGCAHCGKAFADRSNLRAHMQTHSAFKHFSCNKCHKTFALKSYLNKHLESACVKEEILGSDR